MPATQTTRHGPTSPLPATFPDRDATAPGQTSRNGTRYPIEHPAVTGKALVVGYGNPLRRDDGVGGEVARAFAKDAAPGVDVLVCYQLTPELAERLATVPLAVFIDAQIGSAPGGIRISRAQHDDTTHGSILVHHMTPEALLGLSMRLYMRVPDAYLVTVTAGSFELGEGLSKPVAAVLPEAVAAVRQLIRDHPPEREA
jgi:hydrogenase maturation protease